jgi:hypothetical protein
MLRELQRSGQLGPAPLTAFAVTAAVREWYVDDDIEELEYAATLAAARASLRLLDLDPAAARRRVVVAADVPEQAVQVRDDLDRGVVRIEAPIPLPAIASLHVDTADAEQTVAAAAAVVVEADLGDPAAGEAVDDADGFELAWYATQEIGDLLAEF